MLESQRSWFVETILLFSFELVLIVSYMIAIWSLRASRLGMSEELGVALVIMEGSKIKSHLLSKEWIKVGLGRSKVPGTSSLVYIEDFLVGTAVVTGAVLGHSWVGL